MTSTIIMEPYCRETPRLSPPFCLAVLIYILYNISSFVPIALYKLEVITWQDRDDFVIAFSISTCVCISFLRIFHKTLLYLAPVEYNTLVNAIYLIFDQVQMIFYKVILISISGSRGSGHRPNWCPCFWDGRCLD